MSTHNRKATVVGAFEDTKKHKQFLLLKCLRSIYPFGIQDISTKPKYQ